MVYHFLPKTQDFVNFRPYGFVHISPACDLMWSKHLLYGETLDFPCQHYGNIKCPIGKWIFAINLELKLFRATVANAKIGSLESLPTLFDTSLYHMLVKFEQNRMSKYTKFGAFWQKTVVFKTIFGKDLTPYWKTLLSWNNCLMVNY